MKKVLIIVLLALAAWQTYEWLRPVKTVTAVYTVAAGDTLYGICNEAYITKNNSECFNQFLDSNYRKNKRLLQPGDTVVITNRLYQ